MPDSHVRNREPVLGSQCQLCRHREGFAPSRAGDNGQPLPEPRPACRAFPTGIPAAITLDRFDHRKPHRGDRGIRWEPIVEGIEFPKLQPIPMISGDG